MMMFALTRGFCCCVFIVEATIKGFVLGPYFLTEFLVAFLHVVYQSSCWVT